MGALGMLVPLWARVAFVAFVVASVAVIADRHRAGVDAVDKQAALATQQTAFDSRIIAAQTALIDANKRSGDKSAAAQTTVTSAVDDYRRTHDAAPAVPSRVADLASGRERVFVNATCRPANPASNRTVSDHSAPASGTYGGVVSGGAELSRESAGRLGTVGAAADAEVADLRAKLKLGQAYAAAAYAACGKQP